MPVLYRDKDTIDQMRPRIDKDVYLTDPRLPGPACRMLKDVFHLGHERDFSVLDPGAGAGVWGRAVREVWPHSHRTGFDIRELKRPGRGLYQAWFPNFNFPGHTWVLEGQRYHLAVGNPPFSLAETFVRECLKLAHYVCFLLPSDFLHGQDRGRHLYREHPPVAVITLMQRPQFTGPEGESLGDRNTDVYSLVLWTSLWRLHPHDTQHKWLDWKV